MKQEDLLAIPVSQFIARTAAKTPTPGGGSVAGLVGALAAALGEMSLNFTRGKKKYALHEEFYADLAQRLSGVQARFEQLIADDIAAYEKYQAAAAMPEGQAGKAAAQAQALSAAIEGPRRAAAAALQLLEDLRAFGDKCNPYLISDLVAAATLAVAALRMSDYNVRINTRQLADPSAAQQLRQASAHEVQRGAALRDEIERLVSAHL
jgi:formiminotetrahydrofolate cyclodeaminase